MIFSCTYENRLTGERKEQVCTLDANEIAQVERTRKTEGDETAQVWAQALVLRSAYRELDANEWVHLGPPSKLN